MALDENDKKEIQKILKEGSYTVSQEELANQLDLSGQDQSSVSKLLKASQLAYALSELHTKIDDSLIYFTIVKSLFLNFKTSRNFPYLNSAIESTSQKGKWQVNMSVNQFFGSGTGVSGAKNYYVLSGVGLTLAISSGNGIDNLSQDIRWYWGQPRDQIHFALRDPQEMNINAENFKERVSSRLKKALNEKSFVDLFSSSELEDLHPETIERLLQKRVDAFADIFFRPTIRVHVQEQSIEGGSNAVAGEGEIIFSFPNMKELIHQIQQSLASGNAQKLNQQGAQNSSQKLNEELNRNLNFILTQEWIHSLQKEEPSYSENWAFYNSPFNVYIIYGDDDKNWYENQPVEKDAKDLAEEFVRSLSRVSSNLTIWRHPQESN